MCRVSPRNTQRARQNSNFDIQDDVTEVIETLRRKRLVKRFGRLISVINRVVANCQYDISPIDVGSCEDYCGGRQPFFNPGTIANVVLDKDWLLGQTRVR